MSSTRFGREAAVRRALIRTFSESPLSRTA